jgi:hyperosmotically inducible protein
MSITEKNLQVVGTTLFLALTMVATGCHTSGRTTGQAVNDTLLAHEVNHALGRDPVLKYPDVKVSVFNSNAQLTGFVDTDEQRARAAQIAAGVPGVIQVVNEITIKPTPTGRAQIHDVAPPNIPSQAPPPK